MKDFDLTAEVRDCDYKCVKCGLSRLYSILETATINRDDCEKVLVEN